MNQPSKQTVGQLSFVLGILFTLIVLLVFGTKCSAQSNPLINKIGYRDTGILRDKRQLTYDTIHCYILYRTKAGQVGVVKGWQVKQSTKHITYLLSNRRRFPKGTEVWKLDQPIKQ